MNTRAVAAALAAEAPEDGVSFGEEMTLVPSFAAWALIASSGAMRYWEVLVFCCFRLA